MQTQLQIIKDVLTNHTAYSFADEKLSAVKKAVSKRNENYYEYMYQVFSGAENPTIEWGMSNKRFFEGLGNGDFDLSANEADIIKECDRLIAGSTPKH